MRTYSQSFTQLRLMIVGSILNACLLSATALAQPVDDAFLQAGPLESDAAALTAWVEELEKQPKPERALAAWETGEDPSIDRFLAQSHIHFEADGTIRSTYWEILRVNTREAAADVSQVSEEWSPWRMDQPQIRARVLTADGKEIKNDGEHAFEQASSDGSMGVLTDSRRVTVLLNGLVPGSLVETVTESRERPLIGKCQAVRRALTGIAGYRVHRVVITADDGIKPTITSLGSDFETIPADGSSEAEMPFIFQTRDPRSLLELYETSAGPDRVSYPLVMAAVPGDWEELASAYASSVEAAILEGQAAVHAIAATAGPEIHDGSDEAKLRWCADFISRSIRYTGLEFGAQRIYPVDPTTVMTRRFGDCKDQSTLLVALLREFKIPATVALLSSGGSIDVPATVPCMDFFNHAIVYVDKLDRWVDLTAEGYPHGVLPPSCRGRRALLCSSARGALVKTAVSPASQNVETEVRSSRVNFSGGGDAYLLLRSKGDAAAELRAGYEGQSALPLIEAWENYFGSTVGSTELLSLKRAAISENEYAVYSRCGKVQTFSRSGFTIFIGWDLSSILPSLPEPIAPYVDEQGAYVVTDEVRTLPLHLSSGFVREYGVDALFPSALSVGEVPKPYKLQHGLITLETQFELEDVSTFVPELEGFEELVPASEPDDLAYAKEHNRVLKFRAKLTVEPGVMAAEQVNQCLQDVRELLNSTELLQGETTLVWDAGEQHEKNPSNETLKELRAQSKEFPLILDPYVRLMAELNDYGLDAYARKATSPIQTVPKGVSQALSWLTHIRTFNVGAARGIQQISPETDFASIRKLNEGHEASVPLLDRFDLLPAMATNELGLRTVEADKLEAMHEYIVLTRQDPAYSQLPVPLQRGLFNEHVFCALALNKQAEVQTLLRDADIEFYKVLQSIIDGEAFPYGKRFSEEEIEYAERIAFELLLACGRLDLACKMQDVCPSLPLTLPSVEASKLNELDRRDPESVARHTALAILSYDREQLSHLTSGRYEVSELVPPPFFSDVGFEAWFLRQRIGRSLPLVEAFAAIMPLEVQEIGDHGRAVVFTNPYRDEGEEFSTVTLELAKDLTTGDWILVPSREDLATYLVSLCEADRDASAIAWLQHLMPIEAGGFWNWLRGDETAPPSERLWKGLAPELEFRAALASRALACEYTGDPTYLDPWLAEQGIELKPSLQSHVDLIVSMAHLWSKQYSAYFEIQLERAKAAPNFASASRLLNAVEHDKNSGGSLHELESFHEFMKTYFESNEIKTFNVSLKARYDDLCGNLDDALELLRTNFDQPESQVVGFKNSYLWMVLQSKADKAAVENALDEVLGDSGLAGDEPHEYLHTLACAQAMADRPWDALVTLKTILSMRPEQPADDLIRGLVLDSLDFPEAAAEVLEGLIQEERDTDSAVIAKRALAAVSRRVSAPNASD